MASFDSQVDAPLAAIASLAKAAVNAELGVDAIEGVYADPRDLRELKQLPALCIYRQSEIRQRRDEFHVDRVITVTFEYTMPQTDATKRVDRWPALAVVWNAIVDSVVAGEHPNILDNETGEPLRVMDLASSDAVDESPNVNYGFADHGGVSNPHFSGRIVIRHTPESVSMSDLNDFLRLYAGYYQPDTAANLKNDDEVNANRLAETRVDIPQDD